MEDDDGVVVPWGQPAVETAKHNDAEEEGIYSEDEAVRPDGMSNHSGDLKTDMENSEPTKACRRVRQLAS